MSTNENEDESFTLIAIGFAFSIVNIFLSAYTLSAVWNWLLRDFSEKLPELGYRAALGAVLLGMWLTTWRRARDKKADETVGVMLRIGFAETLMLGLILAIAWWWSS